MSDSLDPAPSLPRYDDATAGALLLGRRPGAGEFLGGSVAEGWWNTTLSAGATLGREAAESERDAQPISRDEWRYHPLWRENIAWDERMTVGRARAQAEVYDANRYRRAMMEARDAGALETVLGFGGQLVGSIPDPVNFIPIAGPVGRLARAGQVAAEAGVAARMLGGAATALDRPGVAASALRGTVDALGGNILAAPAVYGVQARYGDEITFDRVLSDLAIGALIGAGFGTIGGVIGRMRDGVDQRAAVRILDAFANDIAAGRPMELPQAFVLRGLQDGLIHGAPPDVAPLLQLLRQARDDGTASIPVPSKPDGTPLSRAEFETMLREQWRGLVTADEAAVIAAHARIRAMQDALDDLPAGSPDAARLAQAIDAEVARFGPAAEADFSRISRLRPEAVQIAAAEARAQVLRERLDATPRGEDEAGRVLAERADRAAADVEASRVSAYDWYLAAHEANRRLPQMAATAPPQTPTGMPPAAQSGRGLAAKRSGRPGGAEGRSAEPGATEDLDMAAAMQQIEALRAEGRLGPADDATLRAGDEQSAELDAVANGLEGAAACMLRTAA